MSHPSCLRSLAVGALAIALGGQALAQTTTTVPALSSRPGAAYTLYLNFGGFNYTGNWAGKRPGTVAPYDGVVPRFDTDGDQSSYSASEVAVIRESFARIAQKYTPFNINVTTVDPAIAAGQAGSDLARQNYYAATPRMMQTIIGGTNAWYSTGAGGVSYVGTTQGSYDTSNTQYHTNWAFPKNLGPDNAKFIAEAAAHEDGHGLGLSHQTDQVSGAGYSTNNGASGNGSYGPIMGAPYNAQRVTWRIGSQNDVTTILAQAGMGGLIEDGIGHTRATATPLAITGSTVNTVLSAGIIQPLNGGNVSPLGAGNYTEDYFAFRSLGGSVTLTSNDGSQFLAAGTADPGATMDSTLTILDIAGNTVGTGLVDSTTLKHTFTGNLTAGVYYAKVGSRGGYTGYEPNAPYFTMGSYFLSGSGVAPVPEPATLAGMMLGLAALARRRRSKRA